MQKLYPVGMGADIFGGVNTRIKAPVGIKLNSAMRGQTIKSLLLLGDYLVAVVAGADRVTVQHIGDKDTPVAHLARVRLAEQDLNSRLHEDVAADDRDTHALNNVGGVLHTAIDALLPLTVAVIETLP